VTDNIVGLSPATLQAIIDGVAAKLQTSTGQSTSNSNKMVEDSSKMHTGK